MLQHITAATRHILQNIKESPASFENDFKIAGKTAIVRKVVSAPLRFAIKNNLIAGNCLNFGKGKATCDTAKIEEIASSCHEFDFVHAPYVQNLDRQYDTVYAGYVLNVLPSKTRELTIKMIAQVTRGYAIIAVRSTRESTMKKLMKTAKPFEDGLRTSSGTFQKGYTAQVLAEEMKTVFRDVQIFKTPCGFEMVRCSHKCVN